MPYKVLAACGSASATSSAAKSKLEENMTDYGFNKNEISISTARIGELPSQIDNADAVVIMSGNAPDLDSDVPIIDGVNLMTGFGEDEVYEELANELK
ncbi:PTS sugar transporter subunit IIB [Haloarcula amylovorans]|uniref:hypothetical protein n=1 Tax=Haloarcula amylovorans TaxID=2562280 RepID=UPI0010766314|nr:hypothetical protein [Halomicroarcula amylolytica]